MAALWCSATSLAFSPHSILCRDRIMPGRSSEPEDHDCTTSPDGRSSRPSGHRREVLHANPEGLSNSKAVVVRDRRSNARKPPARPHNRIMIDSFRTERDTMGDMQVPASALYGPPRAATPGGDDLDPAVKSVTSAFALVQENAAEPVSTENTFYAGVIPGMLHALDPHSNFIEPKEYKEMMRKQQAHYYGVGMQITVDGPKVVVMEPFPVSPASNADLRRGDWISAVDGKDTTGMDTQQVADMLRGPRGTQVRVSVRRSEER